MCSSDFIHQRLNTLQNQAAMAELIARAKINSGLSIRAAIDHAVDVLNAGIDTHPELWSEIHFRVENIFHDPPMGRVPNFSKRVSLLA